jgi:hypothetical protein
MVFRSTGVLGWRVETVAHRGWSTEMALYVLIFGTVLGALALALHGSVRVTLVWLSPSSVPPFDRMCTGIGRLFSRAAALLFLLLLLMVAGAIVYAVFYTKP